MVVAEPLVVRAVAWFAEVQESDDEAGLAGVAADAAGGLDVLGVRLGLAEHHHEAEALDVEADGNHVGGDGAVHALGLVEGE